MEVVEEPLRRGGDELASVHVLGHDEVGSTQDAGVVVETGQDVPRGPPRVRVEREAGRESPRPLLQPLDAQQLVAQRLVRLWAIAFPEQAERCFRLSSSRQTRRRPGSGRPA